MEIKNDAGGGVNLKRFRSLIWVTERERQTQRQAAVSVSGGDSERLRGREARDAAEEPCS